MEISVILPSYQEAENLTILIPKIKFILEIMEVNHEILVIDTDEPLDDTKGLCENMHVIYISREGGNRYGDAIRTGIKKASGKYIVIMDVDGSHDPTDINRFYKEIGCCDVVIGSRYCEGGETDNSFILKFMSLVLNVTYRILFQLPVKDVSDSYRMYKSKYLKKLSLECDNFDIVEEILIKLHYANQDIRLKEIPIKFNKRMAGKSKRDLLKFIMSYLNTIRRLMRIKKNLNMIKI